MLKFTPFTENEGVHESLVSFSGEICRYRYRNNVKTFESEPVFRIRAVRKSNGNFLANLCLCSGTGPSISEDGFEIEEFCSLEAAKKESILLLKMHLRHITSNITASEISSIIKAKQS